MGVHVILDIVPQRIAPAAWAEVFDTVRGLLSAHHARLLGYDWSTAAGVPLPVYTRSIERDRDDPTAHRLCIAGDRVTLAMGDQQTIFRDLGRYLGRCPAGTVPPDDILLAAATDPRSGAPDAPPSTRSVPPYPVPTAPLHRAAGHVRDGVVQVFGEAPCAAACALPLLGAAMMVEARFPKHALVHGDIDRDQAEAARRWAEGVLGRPLALPVRVDAWRLVERLGATLDGQALLRAVERLHLAPPAKRDAALLTIFGRPEAEQWWLARLAAAVRGGPEGARDLLAAYLETTRDPARLCGLACLDARGPRWPPETVVDTLATLRPRIDEATMEQALAVVFGAGAPRLGAQYRARVAAARAERASSPEVELIREVRDAQQRVGVDDLDGLATLPSPADLGPVQREHVHAVAWLGRELLRRLDERGAGREEGPGRPGLLRTIATLLARSGPTLTEDAWDWILREEDIDLLRFLMALAALEPADAAVLKTRRALFENRALCRHAAAVGRDAALMAAVTARVVATGPSWAR